jgi:pimeloyl-ACP methyl ester carboxylesterase
VLDCLVLGEGRPAILVHGTGGGRHETWAKQLPLASNHRLVLPDRRGYGHSPPTEVVDFAADGRDISQLLEPPSHLVGFSYGGVGSLLAAALRPHNVLSIVVIEPPALGVARGHPAVDELVGRLEPVFAGAKHMSIEEHDRAFDEALGLNHVDAPISEEMRARYEAARKERRPWEAHIPFETLRAQTFPKLVFRGDWSPAFSRVAEVIAEGIGAELVTIPGGHGVQHRAGFNERLLAMWSEVELAAL